MKIYAMTDGLPAGLGYIDLDAVRESGYTAGFNSGYTDGYDSIKCYDKEYLTIEMTTSGSVAAWGTYRNVQYRLNGGEWITITTQTVDAEAGDKIEFRGRNSTVDYLFYGDNGHGGQNGITGSCIVYGNIMSLLYGDYFQGKVAFPDQSTRTFLYTFRDCRGITDATNLVLPALTLNGESCRGMFWGCENMVHGPAELPATVLDQACYNTMFKGCAALTVAPELPATTLADRCYYRMFEDCASLVTAPELKATELAEWCYASMFDRCTSLVNVQTVLPATVLKSKCYINMFTACASLERAPELPATECADPNDVYNQMFNGCDSLNYVKCMLLNNDENPIYIGNWITNRTLPRVLGTFVKNRDAVWTMDSTSGIPQGWTVVDAS